MKISTGTARAIVREISKAVNQNVNLMDETGRIIASTNPKRVGTSHVGAKKIIEEQLECLTIYTDQEYSGSKMGINMPIYFRGEIVGVIGISGEWSQISQYVQLIRKVTEVLLADSYLQEEADVVRARRRSYLHDLLFEEPARLPDDFFGAGKTLGVDPELARRCLCVSFAGRDGMYPRDIQMLLDAAEKAAARASGDALLYRELSQLCIFLPAGSDAELTSFAGRLAALAPVPQDVRFKAGADDGPHTGTQLRTGKAKAEKSLKFALSGAGEDLAFYAQMTSGIYLSEISHTARKDYLERIFPFMEPGELRSWIHLLQVFYACDGSITQAAEKLFIHKNTLQYQLKKLASLTGYDPRSISNAGLYQTAILFFQSL